MKEEQILYVVFKIPLTKKGYFDNRSFKKENFREPHLHAKRNTMKKFIVTNSKVMLDMNTIKFDEILQRLLCNFHAWVLNYEGHAYPLAEDYIEGYWQRVLEHLIKQYPVISKDDFYQKEIRRILEPLTIGDEDG